MRILIVCVAMLSAALQGAAVQEPRVVRIVAERFTFTPSRIEIDAGESVELVLKSDDTSHGLRIEEAGVDTVIPKRGSGDVRVVVRIDKPGRYRFECSRVCGAGHDFMRGELVVRPVQGAGQ
jgi:cytochrome c oxidase subunit II